MYRFWKRKPENKFSMLSLCMKKLKVSSKKFLGKQLLGEIGKLSAYEIPDNLSNNFT